jgi:DNA-binding IscR family transcriptional regulator
MATTSFQFAVWTHIMAVLEYHYGYPVPSKDPAGSVKAEYSFVGKTLSKLSKAGLVTATRGKNGFSKLSRPPGEISLHDIYLASEAPPPFAVHDYPIEVTCLSART